jgi:hypothetical protein
VAIAICRRSVHSPPSPKKITREAASFSNLTGRQQRAQRLRAGSWVEQNWQRPPACVRYPLGKTIVDRDILPLDEAIL